MPNPYESGAQKIIPAVLLYAFHGHRILMIHRNIKVDDHHQGKWNGLGGKLEFGETFLEAAVREFEEEAHVSTKISQWQWAGQLFFPNFKEQKKEDWWVNVYITELTDAEAAQATAPDLIPSEGTLHWVELSRVMCLNLWDGDKNFIPYVLDRKPFQGTLFYSQGTCVRSEVNLIDFQAKNP